MDWQAAIERNRMALEKVLAGLIALAGLAVPTGFTSPLREGRREAPGGDCGLTATLPRHLYLFVLRLLRPAESAARRLVIAMARDIVIPPLPARLPCAKKPKSAFLRNGVGTGIVMPKGTVLRPAPPQRAPVFSLTDPLRRPAFDHPGRRTVFAGVPRISFPGLCKPFPVAVRRLPLPDDPIDVSRLMARLRALAAALDDLPAQAQRFARWRTRRDAGRVRRVVPLRGGMPPGARGRRGGASHPVDAILADANWLAFMALERRDTS